jgi:hypothetical protein
MVSKMDELTKIFFFNFLFSILGIPGLCFIDFEVRNRLKNLQISFCTISGNFANLSMIMVKAQKINNKISYLSRFWSQ